jgi:hypothetical protein
MSHPGPSSRACAPPSRATHLEQLKKQAKGLLEQFRSGEASAVSEVLQFQHKPDPITFALNDSQGRAGSGLWLCKLA